MPEPAKPEILPPEMLPPPVLALTLRKRAEGWFSDENLDFFAHLLDDWFRIPCTPIRIGLDGLIGLIPGLGDVLAGIASFVLVFAAWIRGVPYDHPGPHDGQHRHRSPHRLHSALRRRLRHRVEGEPPQLPLMMRHLRQPHRHTWKDYAFLLSLLGAVLAILAIPIIVLLLILLWIAHRM